jgi:hypothetical protein
VAGRKIYPDKRSDGEGNIRVGCVIASLLWNLSVANKRTRKASSISGRAKKFRRKRGQRRTRSGEKSLESSDGVTTEDQFIRSIAVGGMDRSVIGIRDEGEKEVPIIVRVVHITGKHFCERTIKPLSQTVRLGVISGGSRMKRAT